MDTTVRGMDNAVTTQLRQRTSTRVFEPRPIPGEAKQAILDCAFAAPTAGNQMLYSIIDVDDPAAKAVLADTCDHQPFIAQAPWVLVFLADCRRWLDAYAAAGCADVRPPGPADLMLACADAVIAAQNAVTAAWSLGIGSCYIGDIVEQRERVVDLLGLDPYVFPAALLVFGYPTAQQRGRAKPARFGAPYLVHRDRYRRLGPDELRAMHAGRGEDFERAVRGVCERKYQSGFSAEMNRCVRDYLACFL